VKNLARGFGLALRKVPKQGETVPASAKTRPALSQPRASHLNAHNNQKAPDPFCKNFFGKRPVSIYSEQMAELTEDF